MGFGRMTLGFVLEPMRAEVMNSYAGVGLAGAANLAGYLVGVMSANRLIARSAADVVLRRWLWAATLSLALMAASANLWTCLAASALCGITGGVVWIACLPVLSGTTPQHRRGAAFGLMASGIGVSIVACGAIAQIVAWQFDPDAWREVWLTEAALGVVVCLLVRGLLSPIPAARPYEVSPSAPQRLPRRRHRRSMVPAGIAWAIVLYLFWGIAHGIYSNFLVAAAQGSARMSTEAATSIYSLLGLTNVAGGLLLGQLSDRFGRRTVLVPAMACVAAAAMAVPFGSPALLVASAAVYGLIMSGLPSVLTATLSDRLTVDVLPVGYAAVTLAVGMGQLISPPVAGALVDASGGFLWSFAVSAAAALGGAVAATRLGDVPRRPAGSAG